MAYNQRAASPRPSLAQLRAPSRQDSNPPSPVVASPSASTFAFPPSASPSNPPYQYPPPLTSANSYSSNLSSTTTASATNGTARFHEALASLPTSRHRPTESTASEASFRFPPDSASPSGEKAFDALQREFNPPGGIVGLGFEEDDEPAPARDPSPRFGRSFDESGKIYEEPESVAGLDGMAVRTVRRGKERADQLGAEDTAGEMPSQAGRLDRSIGSSGIASLGRPASIDMGGGEGASEADTSFDFLLSPPAFDATSSSARQFAAAAGDAPKPKGRDRTFPAPLLLKSDRNRPFAAPASPVLGTTAPLVINRKMSASSASFGEPLTSSAPLPSSQAPSRWAAPSSSMPPPSIENHRSNLPYQQHRSKTSSTSSFTHGTSPLAYSHSSQHSGSSALTMASPVITNGGSFAAPPPSTTIAPSAPTTTTDPPPAPEPPITPQALLLQVRLLRSPSQPMALSQSQGPLSRLNTTGAFAQPASHQRIRSAGSTASDNDAESPTRGPTLGKLDTVDLSHKRIAEVPNEVVHELQDEVEKLALGYNLLRDLPPHFVALGGKLRYLNVRVNVLTTFPQVLCEMPSLEILDISRNKIKRLPTTPGSLVNLKVFSIAKNRVKRLPTWLAHMSHLKVLKIDHNPLEWPPTEITTFPANGSQGGGPGASISKVEEAEEMQRWLPALQRWVRENAMKENGRERSREEPHFDRRRRPSVMSQTTDDERSSSNHHEERSIDSTTTSRPGGMTRTESGRVIISPSTPSSATFPRPRVTPPSTSQGPPPVVSVDTLEEDPSVRHSRNASHSTTQSLHPEARPGLRSKKSLPDLRQSHADILAERRTGAVPAEEKTPRPALGGALRRLNQERPLGMVHSNSARAVFPTQASIATAPPPTSSTPVPPPASLIPRSQSARPLPSATVKPSTARAIAAGLSTTMAKVNFDGAKTKRAQADTNAPSFDRNSGAYFRRLSMLPTSTISKTVPVTLLEFADAIRGILFSLSQIYSALRQFVVFASQDRLPAPIARLMGTADGTMSDLINALDRFDSLSRRGTPSPNIVRDIFIACRESVGTFKQLVAALGPQLKSLIATADVRYTRTLLLMLYGSMGEIANSWNAVSPLLAEITSIGDDPSLATLILQPPTPSPTLSSSSSSRPSNGGPGTLYRARSKTRRHAGSFSVEDVQLGAVLPPAPIPDMPGFPSENPFNPGTTPHPQLSASTSSLQDDNSNGGGTVKARPTKVNRGPGAITLPPSMGYRDMVMKAFEQPMTPGAGELNFSEPDGAATSNGAGAGAPSGGSSSYLPATGMVTPSGSFSLPPSEGRGRPVSTANADATFVDMAESTITIARSIYAMLLDSFDADYDDDEDGSGVLMRELGPRRVKELTDLCILGNETTTKLRGALGRVRAPDSRGPLKFSPADAKRLGDEAYAFVQTVIRFAKLVKAISLEHGFAPRIREGVGQLTIATRELAKSLHTATSFRPSVPSSTSSGGAPTPRP